jgi:hypothetical protein
LCNHPLTLSDFLVMIMHPWGRGGGEESWRVLAC